MMIRMTDTRGTITWLHPDAVATIAEAPASSQWHGVRSIVRTFDGQVLEATQEPVDLVSQIQTCRRSIASDYQGADDP